MERCSGTGQTSLLDLSAKNLGKQNGRAQTSLTWQAKKHQTHLDTVLAYRQQHLQQMKHVRAQVLSLRRNEDGPFLSIALCYQGDRVALGSLVSVFPAVPQEDRDPESCKVETNDEFKQWAGEVEVVGVIQWVELQVTKGLQISHLKKVQIVSRIANCQVLTHINVNNSWTLLRKNQRIFVLRTGRPSSER